MLIKQSHAVADKTEPIVGRVDPIRSPFSLSDVEAFQNWARRFLPEATPTWGLFLGIAWQPGDVVIEVPGEFSLAGKQTALGALAVIIPGLVRRRGRCDALIAEVAGAALGAKFVAGRDSSPRGLLGEARSPVALKSDKPTPESALRRI